MEAVNTKTNKKKPREVISFRFDSQVKTRLELMAEKENLDLSDIFSRVFIKGLSELYNMKIIGKELVQ